MFFVLLMQAVHHLHHFSVLLFCAGWITGQLWSGCAYQRKCKVNEQVCFGHNPPAISSVSCVHKFTVHAIGEIAFDQILASMCVF